MIRTRAPLPPHRAAARHRLFTLPSTSRLTRPKTPYARQARPARTSARLAAMRMHLAVTAPSGRLPTRVKKGSLVFAARAPRGGCYRTAAARMPRPRQASASSPLGQRRSGYCLRPRLDRSGSCGAALARCRGIRFFVNREASGPRPMASASRPRAASGAGQSESSHTVSQFCPVARHEASARCNHPGPHFDDPRLFR
jgi:hypothetical protein